MRKLQSKPWSGGGNFENTVSLKAAGISVVG